MPTLSTPERTKLSETLARALSVDGVNDLGRKTGQAERLRTVTPHRLFLAIVSTLGSGRVESLADLLRAFNYQHGESERSTVRPRPRPAHRPLASRIARSKGGLSDHL